jgi:hypothetical protein
VSTRSYGCWEPSATVTTNWTVRGSTTSSWPSPGPPTRTANIFVLLPRWPTWGVSAPNGQALEPRAYRARGGAAAAPVEHRWDIRRFPRDPDDHEY